MIRLSVFVEEVVHRAQQQPQDLPPPARTGLADSPADSPSAARPTFLCRQCRPAPVPAVPRQSPGSRNSRRQRRASGYLAGDIERLQHRRLLRKQAALHLARNLHFLLDPSLGVDSFGHLSASEMLRIAIPAWLATDASSRLSRAEYGSSERRGPSTTSPCNSPSLDPRIGTRHSAPRFSSGVPRSVAGFTSTGSLRPANRVCSPALSGRSAAFSGRFPAYARSYPLTREQVNVQRHGMQRFLYLAMQQCCQPLAIGDRQRGRGQRLQNLLCVVGAAEKRSVQPRSHMAVHLRRARDEQHPRTSRRSESRLAFRR